MLNIENVLSRADEIDIQRILSPQTLKMLSLVNKNFRYNSKLKELIKEVKGIESLLLEPKLRNMIIDLLKPKEIKDLSIILGLYGSPNSSIYNIYKQVKKKRYTRGSRDEKDLFTFFNMSPLPIEEKNDEVELTETTGHYQLFRHQRDAAIKTKRLLNEHPKRLLLHMPTGSGKTRTSMNIIADHFRENEPSVVIWLAASEELCEQAVEEFEKAWRFLGNRQIDIHRFWGGRSLDLRKVKDGFLVAGLSKIHTTSNGSEGYEFLATLGNKVSMIVVDEAHQSIAPTYKFIIDALFGHHQNKKLLGLSATPGRTYNDIDKDRELSNFFSSKKVILEVEGYENPVDYLTDEGYIAKVEYRQLFHKGTIFSDQDLDNFAELPREILNKIGEDEQRNIKIVFEAKRLSKKHNRILLFAPSVDSSENIAFVLNTLGLKARSLTGGTESIRRKSIIDDFKNDENEVKILCNYGVLTTGFDAPKTSAAIIARPTISLVLYSQMIGRAIRGEKAGGNKEAEIVTVIDQGLPGFRSVAESFINWEDVWS